MREDNQFYITLGVLGIAAVIGSLSVILARPGYPGIIGILLSPAVMGLFLIIGFAAAFIAGTSIETS